MIVCLILAGIVIYFWLSSRKMFHCPVCKLPSACTVKKEFIDMPIGTKDIFLGEERECLNCGHSGYAFEHEIEAALTKKDG